MKLVSGSARVLAGIGTAADRVARPVHAAPRTMRATLRGRVERRIFAIAGSVILVLYLLAIGDIAVSLSGRWTAVPAVRFVPDGLFHARAPYLFEPVLALYPGSHIAIFLSPINVLLGMLVAALAGLNIALAAHGARQVVACRRPGYSRSLAVLPAFLVGFACCVPTFLLALGAGTAAAVLPVLLPVQPLFYPITLFLLLAALLWGVARIESGRRGGASPALAHDHSAEHERSE